MKDWFQGRHLNFINPRKTASKTGAYLSELQEFKNFKKADLLTKFLNVNIAVMFSILFINLTNSFSIYRFLN